MKKPNEATASALEISIILPVRNEQESLPTLDGELRAVLPGLNRRSEIIFVNDGSTDETASILDELIARAAGDGIPTRVITLRRGYGQTAAMAAGIDHAEGEIIISLDADGQNNPADIPRLLARLEDGFDVVCGWREARKDGLVFRTFPSAVANWLIRSATGVPIHDTGCTLKAYRAPLLREIRLYGEMHRYLPVFLIEKGARITEIKVDHRPRKSGVSKYGLERIIKVLADLFFMQFIAKYDTRPMHIFGLVGALFFLASLFTLGLMLAFKYGWLQFLGIGYRANFVETPLPTLTAIFFLGGFVSVSAGTLAEVLVRLRFEAGNVKAYSVRKIDESRSEQD